MLERTDQVNLECLHDQMVILKHHNEIKLKTCNKVLVKPEPLSNDDGTPESGLTNFKGGSSYGRTCKHSGKDHVNRNGDISADVAVTDLNVLYFGDLASWSLGSTADFHS